MIRLTVLKNLDKQIQLFLNPHFITKKAPSDPLGECINLHIALEKGLYLIAENWTQILC